MLSKLGDKATMPLKILTLIGAAVLAARFLIASDSFNSALLYIAWPFLLSLAIYYLTPHTDGGTWKRRFWNNIRITTIVILASSLILMEGYVCVAMALPIFFVGVLFAFMCNYLYHRYGKNSVPVHVATVLVALVSMEGVTGATSFNRFNEVSYSQVVHMDAKTIQQKLMRPAQPTQQRHWLLTIFPMPKTIDAVNIRKGAVRVYEFTYHRWFATNTHEGEIKVAFTDVSDTRIKTEITDTSYIASYMKLHGTELVLAPLGNGQTKVTLKVSFDRMIDPVWYFEPLERFAVKKAAEYFVRNFLKDRA